MPAVASDLRQRGHDELLVRALDASSARAGTVVVACTGGFRAPLGPIPAHAYVTDFVPYADLLPKADVMITNGGYGGVPAELGADRSMAIDPSSGRG
ncbi:glycosyltransferase [Nocardia goodfellowii]